MSNRVHPSIYLQQPREESGENSLDQEFEERNTTIKEKCIIYEERRMRSYTNQSWNGVNYKSIKKVKPVDYVRILSHMRLQ